MEGQGEGIVGGALGPKGKGGRWEYRQGNNGQGNGDQGIALSKGNNKNAKDEKGHKGRVRWARLLEDSWVSWWHHIAAPEDWRTPCGSQDARGGPLERPDALSQDRQFLPVGVATLRVACDS